MKIFLLLPTSLLLTACMEAPGSSAALKLSSADISAREPTTAECTNPLSDYRKRFNKLMSDARYLEAAHHLEQCKSPASLAALQDFIRDARRKNLVQRFVNTELPDDSRLMAFDGLRRDFPGEIQSLEAEALTLKRKREQQLAAEKVEASRRSQQRESVQKIELARERAQWKRSGVSIGMTAERVIQSSWGRPESINRTTTQHVRSEQWVYGTGNYLYFEDGILVAIQN